jgi:NAD-dependent DNA ligase
MSDIINMINKSQDVIHSLDKLTICELENAIKYCADKYYNKSVSVVEDAVYDMMVDFLQLKAPKSSVLKTVGAKVATGSRKVSLDYWLGSMDKIKPQTNHLNIWMKKYKSPYVLSDKIDGISVLIVYRNNGVINMYTRGTSNEGTDISHLVKYMNLPTFDSVRQYFNSTKNMIAFRGEAVICKSIFDSKWADEFKNARNMVSGCLLSKKSNPHVASDIEIIIYEVVDPQFNIMNQLKIIKELGFNCVYYKIYQNILTFDYLSEYFIKRRNKSKYMIDGIIVTNNDDHKRNKTGNPEYAFAYKDVLEEQKTITQIQGIDWNISKDGYIIPTLLLEPCHVAGIEIKRVTGNNARNVVNNNLGEGAIVEIIRSGDVIPKIVRVIKPGKVVLPKGKWSWSSTDVDIIVDDTNDVNILKKNIYFFFSTLKTKGLGEKVIEKLYNAGYDSVIKILSMTKTELMKNTIDGFKEKTIDNILKSIKQSTQNITLAQLMTASNKLGHGLGLERMKTITNNIPKILDYYKVWTHKEFINKIMELDGFDTKTATLFVDNFKDFIIFFNQIKKYIKITELTINIGKMSNITIVFSGFRDKELQNEIELQGGKVGSTITGNTDYLVVKNNTMTTKLQKAKDNGIKIITRTELELMLA